MVQMVGLLAVNKMNQSYYMKDIIILTNFSRANQCITPKSTKITKN